MTDFAIDVAGLHKSFGKQAVLAGIDLRVRAGTVFALLGPNGAGKTTLINILSTLTSPDSGAVRVAGHDVVREPDKVRRAISLTGQYAAVDEVLTGAENLRMMARLSGFGTQEARVRANEMLKQFDLVEAADKRVKAYSGGMRRRLDLAISLLSSPPVIFLDEPTTGLDTRSRQALWLIIQGLAAQGTTIFLTTQYLEEADQLADRIAVIHNGIVAAEGTASELKGRVGGEVVQLSNEDDATIREIPTDGSIDGLRSAIDELASVAPTGGRVHLRKPSLDDVFIALTGHVSAETEIRTGTVSTTSELEDAKS
ncbi:ATP-binding cassette domain-containing protein [Saxibacter everestensis]|uniref:ATP-binding cassette domain-containing protein n=1 Tax=Saxibacter everestensis TaxID=2909229 RepID=A0ABY8QQ36_9MICO|nr:ATP-binding cassette domain-containing protein [Brevibacteriaceae bacterium ZFBP1038]